jgi:branched-chain amino acid transport system substrate-binding protein
MQKKRGCVAVMKGMIVVAAVVLVMVPALVMAADTIRIGAAISMTGKSAREGGLVKKGYDTWVEWINARGGIMVGGKPYKVEMVYYDDKGEATTSAKLTEKLITEDKVNLILGPYSSGIVAATSAIAERYGFVTIAPMANGDFVYERGLKYLFSALPPASRDLVPVVELAAQQTNPKPKTYAVVVLDHAFALPAIGGAQKRSQELGLQEVYYGKFQFNTTDFSNILTAVKSKEPDLIYFAGFPADTFSFFRQVKELNVNAKMFAGTLCAGNPDWIPTMKKDGNYVIGELPWHQDMGYKDQFFSSKSFYDFWLKRHKEPANTLSAPGFATGLLIQLAIEKAGSLDQTKIRDALRAMEVETFFGKFKWDEKGRNIAGRMGVVQTQNEKDVLIDPPQPGVKFLYPAPAWKDR